MPKQSESTRKYFFSSRNILDLDMVYMAASRYWGPDLAYAELLLTFGTLVLYPSWVQDTTEQSAQHICN
jgi:hypothetical protein